MKPLSLATGIVALLVLSAWAAGLLQKPQARVLCHDSRRGYLSADMDLEDVTQTPAGWVLYFPHRADPERRVEAWEACEVHQ